MGTILELALVAVSCSTVVAQMTATVTQTIQLQGTGQPTVSLYPGPVLAPGAMLTHGSGFTQSGVLVQPVPGNSNHGSPGWLVSASLRNHATGFPAMSGVTGRLELSTYAAQPRSGVLTLLPYWVDDQFTVCTGTVTVDTNCDNVPDYFSGTSPYIEIPWVATPAGTRIWIDFNLVMTVNYQAGSGTYGHAIRSWSVMFVPEHYGVQFHSAGCIGGMTVMRSLLDLNVRVGVSDPAAWPQQPPTIAGAWLLVGLAPGSSTLPIAPFCTVGVQSPVIVPPGGFSSATEMVWVLPNAQLPPGLQFFTQAVWLGTNGLAHTTDVWRTF